VTVSARHADHTDVMLIPDVVSPVVMLSAAKHDRVDACRCALALVVYIVTSPLIFS